ncbi:MAG: hypothetical protein CMF59_01850 [Leptospiraceae bacterium]|nr:hypothetical protein [Leptospiraceae bacterium]
MSSQFPAGESNFFQTVETGCESGFCSSRGSFTGADLGRPGKRHMVQASVGPLRASLVNGDLFVQSKRIDMNCTK